MFQVEQRIKPVLKWAGGKSSLLPQLTQRFPERFSRYIEPFLGSGACFFALSHKVPAILNDRNPELVHLYTVVKHFPEELMRELDRLTLKYSETFFYDLRATNPRNKIKRAARTVFLNKTGFNGLYRQNSQGTFNVPFGKRKHCPKLYDRMNLLAASRKLKKAQIICADFEEVINLAKKGDFIYCDPPYEPLSQTSSFNTYTGKGFTRVEQTRLRDAVSRATLRGAKVAISNSEVSFIEDLYDGFDIHRVKARRAINSKGNLRGQINELLILA